MGRAKTLPSRLYSCAVQRLTPSGCAQQARRDEPHDRQAADRQATASCPPLRAARILRRRRAGHRRRGGSARIAMARRSMCAMRSSTINMSSNALKAKGAIFVEELVEVPDTEQPVIFSAHGVPKSIPDEAQARNIFAIDATCPLVTKVHREAEIHHRHGRQVLLVGHAGHPEVVGTLGQLPASSSCSSRPSKMSSALPQRDQPIWPLSPRRRCRSTIRAESSPP